MALSVVCILLQFIYGQENSDSRNLENFFHWMVTIDINCLDESWLSIPLDFGFDPNATHDFDNGLDQYRLPGPPPPCFYAFLDYNFNLYYRCFLPSSNEENTILLTLYYAADTEGGSIPNIIQWNAEVYAELGTFCLRDAEGAYINLDMTNPDEDSLTLSEDRILSYDFTDSSNCSITLGYLMTNLELVVTPNGNSGYWSFGPTVDFYTSADTIAQGNSVQFFGEVLPGEYEITSWYWDFGDGDTSNIQSPVHSYSDLGTYSVLVTVTDENGDSATEVKTDLITIASSTKIDDVQNYSPSSFWINNYPNPFNPTTTILFSIPITEASHIAYLRVYDITGRLVETLVNGITDPDMHTVKWNAFDFPSGVYFVQMLVGRESKMQKILFLK